MSVGLEVGSAIRLSIETLIIEHTAFTDALALLRRRVKDTFAGFAPCFEILSGFSRCGKTEILKVLARDFPESSSNGRRLVPLLVVYVTSSTTPKDLPLAVIRALGLPTPKHSMKVGELNSYMHTQLRLAGVQVILFDEASHLVDVGTRIPPRAASDWFKDLQATSKTIGIVLTGVPRLRRLADSNEQLRNRMRRPITLMPYRWDDASQRQAFAGCVVAFLNEFRDRSCEPAMPINSFVRHCYAASAGQIGLLANFFLELAMLIDLPRQLDFDICSDAAASINLPGNKTVLPFASDTLEDGQLMQVLASEYAVYELVLPPITVEAELANGKLMAIPIRAVKK